MQRIKGWLTIAGVFLLTVTGVLVAPSANAAFDVYTTPGEHTIEGRHWRTWCEPYSQTARCRTEIKVGGVWTFNNLTYLPSPRSLWRTNPLAIPGDHHLSGRGERAEATPHFTKRRCLYRRSNACADSDAL